MSCKYTLQDHLGKKFGRWTVIGDGKRDGRKHQFWCCRCECGEEREVRADALLRGDSESCGCLAFELSARRLLTHGRSFDILYGIWSHMIRRCFDPSDNAYRDYGARGITVCDRWRESPRNFIDDMGPRPTSKHTLDRINNDGNYCPENCRWATDKQQARNTRANRMLTHQGKTLSLAEWSEITGINYGTIKSRLNRYGWSVERALTTKAGR